MKVTKITTAFPSARGQQTKHEEKNSTQLLATNPILKQQDKAASMMFANYFKASQAVNPSFTGFPCSTSNFRVKELEDMPCTCCGRPMMTNKQIDEFSAKAGTLVGADLDKYLEENIEYFRAEEKAVVHYIQKQLKDTPDASLTTAISRTNADGGAILKDEQIDVLKRTSEKAKELLGKENQVSTLVDTTLKGFNTPFRAKKDSRGFDRTGFLNQVVKMEKQGVAHKDIHEILDVATQLPESEKTIDKMLSKYANAKDSVFARRLIQKAIVTAEHIHPKSLGGPNATDNYMGECQTCNGDRGNMSYDIWMTKYPNMPENIQENIDAVTEEIVKGKIGGNYDDYPVDLKKAIDKETDGKVILRVKNPEEIDKMREERGLPKPEKSQKERSGAGGASQSSRTPKTEEQTTAPTSPSGKSQKKRRPRRHLSELN
jgi:hypothetical protein